MAQGSAISASSTTQTGGTPPYRRILVPIDGSALSRAAAEQALALATAIGAAVVFLTVNEPFHILTTSTEMIEASREEYERQAELRADQILEQAGEAALDAGVSFITVRKWSEDPYIEIIDVAHERCCDLIAMGSHGRRGASALLLGSVTHKVLTHSTLPVLVIRQPGDATPGRLRALAETASQFAAGIG
jgi:nucleotide-binding universal stress UspA family protein